MYLIVIFFFTTVKLSFLANPIPLHDSIASTSITPDIECKLDRPYEKYKTYNKEVISFGYIPDTIVWCRFALKNESNATRSALLEYADPVVANIVLYDLKEDTMKFDGYYYDNAWPINPVFLLEFEPNQTRNFHLLAYSDSSALAVSLKLWKPELFYKTERDHQVILALYFGAMAALILYNLMLFLFTRDMSYLAYVLYMTAVNHAQIFYTTFVELFVPLDFRISFEGEFYSSLMIIAMPITGLYFTKVYLSLQQYHILYRVYQLFMGINLLYLFLSLFPQYCNMETSVFITMASSVFMLYSGWHALILGNKQARYIVIGWTLAITAILFQASRNLDINHVLDDLPYLVEFAYFTEGVLFSIALAARFKQLRDEKKQLEMQKHDAETEARLHESEARLKATLLQEMHHRVNDNLSIISSFLSLQKRRSDSPIVINALASAVNRVLSLAQLHRLLRYDDPDLTIDAEEYFRSITDHLATISINPVTIDVEAPYQLKATQAYHCAIIINELVTNALRHAFDEKGGRIKVSLNLDQDQAILEISDNGRGFDPSLPSSSSLGLDLVNWFGNKELNAKITTLYDRGTHFTIRFAYEPV